MKVYYIFKIKKEFLSLYKDTPNILYHILRKIYYMDKDSVNIGYNLFNQLIDHIDKNTYDRDLYIKLHQESPYVKRDDYHIINNLYRNEISRLRINNFFMKLELDQDYSSFYELLNLKDSNLFVCNFKVIDYFFLHDYLQKDL